MSAIRISSRSTSLVFTIQGLFVPFTILIMLLLLAGCETTPGPVIPASQRLQRIENLAVDEEDRLRTAYRQTQAKLYSLERVKETEQNAYLAGQGAPQTVITPPAGFANAEAWRTHLESERDALAAAIVEIEDIQKRLYKQRRQAEADEAPIIPQLRIR